MAAEDELAGFDPGTNPIPADLLEGLGSQSQLDFDIGFFDHILQRAPEQIDVLRCQGELLSRRGLNDRALDVDRRLALLLPKDAVVRYNLACSLALGGLETEALMAVRRALELGYDDFALLETDGDLDCLRSLPGWLELLREFGID